MFTRTLLCRAFTLHLTSSSSSIFRNSFSSTSAMATTTAQNFTLDRSLWNPSLYTRMRTFWFADVPPDASVPPLETEKKWFGVGMSQQQKDAFDRECADNFGAAVDSIGPENLTLPEWEGYERDVDEADAISGPFLQEVKDAQAESEKKGADTLLSLILLLDQIPRNVHRDPAGLKRTFTHYDRLAHALLQSSLRLHHNPIQHSSFRNKPVYQTWFLLPLMHAEDLPAHEIFQSIAQGWREHAAGAGDQTVLKAWDNSLAFAAEHDEPLRRFGRYPHRNQCLGRESTREEAEYLKGASTFGVRQDGDGGEGGDGKSEL